jgi:spermidine/putrescine-binding protein
VAVTTDDVTKRAVTAPNSFDLIDTEYFSLKKIVPTGNLKGIDTKKIKNADKITTLFTKGKVAWQDRGRPGHCAQESDFLGRRKAKVFCQEPDAVTCRSIPTVYNADTLGIRPDLIKRPITSWAELLEPRVQGQGRHPEHSVHRHHGRGHGGRGHGHLQISRQGQHDQEGDRPDHQDPDRGQESQASSAACGKTSMSPST